VGGLPGPRGLRRRLPQLAALLAVDAARRRGPRRAFGLVLVAVAGYGAAAGFRRRYERRLHSVHMERLARLRPEVLSAVYEHASALTEKVQRWPHYDRRRNHSRHRLVAARALGVMPPGAVVLDVGCAGGEVLDMLGGARPARLLGIDINPRGLELRAARPGAPEMTRAPVEAIPHPDGIADVVVFSEVIEHLVDAYAGLREVSRVTRLGGFVVLTTNNASEMPEVSPLCDPVAWLERLAARWHPGVLAFREVIWPQPVPRELDPRPVDTPTHPLHIHLSYSELRDLGASAGLRVEASTSFHFPPPQTRAAGWLRRLSERWPGAGDHVTDLVEATCAHVPLLRFMGTHNLLVYTKVAEPLPLPAEPWWPAEVVAAGRSA
jgi:2-polyprenyl-3-methyl-5-hydroxy-6-metoxy-1,4-benzoquinol methylase